MKRFREYTRLDEQQATPRPANPVEVDAYHGSGKLFKKFEQKHARIQNDFFGGGIGYFTDHHGVGKTYAKSMARSQKTNTPYVYHTKLKMKNVFDVDHEFTGDHLKHLLPDDEKEHERFARGAGLMRAGADRFKVLNDLKTGSHKLTGKQVFFGLSHGGINTAKARDHLIKKGYDGIRYNGGENMGMDTRHNVYMPYNADSIKIHKITTITKKIT
jgi:hypothetical protein